MFRFMVTKFPRYLNANQNAAVYIVRSLTLKGLEYLIHSLPVGNLIRVATLYPKFA